MRGHTPAAIDGDNIVDPAATFGYYTFIIYIYLPKRGSWIALALSLIDVAEVWPGVADAIEK